MATNNNLQGSLNWCGAYINYLPQLIGGQEPALSNANLVLQTVLGPPFTWRFNRATFTFNCVVTAPIPTQDYIVAVPDFGFLEKAWVKMPDNTDQKELDIENVLGLGLEKGRPKSIAAQSDDNLGNITMRLLSGPDAAYIVSGNYQKKAPIMTSVVSNWGPLPDELSYIYNWGFLALSAIVANDSRFPIFNQKFTSHLLGAQEGLDEMKRNIFLGEWLAITKAAERAQLKTQQGIGARQN